MTIAYIAIAGLCLVLHNLVMIVADHVSAPLWLGVLLSFTIVGSTGYVLHGHFTFRQRLTVIAFCRYALAMSANIPLALVATWAWRDQIGLPMPIAAPLASICMLAINFALARFAITTPTKWMALSR